MSTKEGVLVVKAVIPHGYEKDFAVDFTQVRLTFIKSFDRVGTWYFRGVFRVIISINIS